MNQKIDLKSIKFKTCLYFIFFAAALILSVWVLQIFILNYFYGAMKTHQTKEVVKDIKTSYRSSSTFDFLNDIESISDTYDMYIYVVSYDEGTTYFRPSENNVARIPGLETEEDEDDSDVPLKYRAQIENLREHMIEDNGEAYLRLTGTDRDQAILAYGGILKSNDKDPMIVYLFSPLWPISSTINILKNNLIMVTIFSLIIAFLFSLYLSTRISRPIRKITASAKRLADGEYGIVFSGGHYTEIIDLADTLTAASIGLEKADMMQKDLIANVSHDLKTPLTMIKSYAEMIRDLSGDNPEKRAKHLQVIIDETDRLNDLVEDMLTISRLQSGKLTLDAEIFSLTDAVSTIMDTYKVMEVGSNYIFKLECEADFYVNADQHKIKQVVSNFITNAIKFCGEDNTIIVSLVRKSRNVRLTVEDHGRGISADELDHVWERYYRSSSHTVREVEGSGLGLSICKEILTLHKALFGVDSILGEGSRFWFELPLVARPSNEDNDVPDAEYTLIDESHNTSEIKLLQTGSSPAANEPAPAGSDDTADNADIKDAGGTDGAVVGADGSVNANTANKSVDANGADGLVDAIGTVGAIDADKSGRNS